MPELPVKEIRMPELHLPEIKRDDIVRSLSEMRLPDVDVPDSVSKIDWPKIDLSSVDVGKAMAGAAAAAHIGRRAGRPRWPLAVGGLIVVGLATWAIVTNDAIRSRLSGAGSAVRERFQAMRSDENDLLDIDRDDPIAFDAAETAPIESAPYGDDTTTEATGYPDGLGNDRDNGTPAFEEAVSRD